MARVNETERAKRLMVIGAHPDDCEAVGGIALTLKSLGWRVRFLSATDGSAGHQSMPPEALAERRREEARKVSGLTGIEYEILDNEDGYLTAGLKERMMIMAAIRAFQPDAVITHRPWDYHPDHRNTSILVQDCAYLLQVPNVLPESPIMPFQPAVFHMQDGFTKPCPFRADLVFDVSGQAEKKLLMYHQHASQMYEWLPWVDRTDLSEIPEGDAERLAWLSRTRFNTRSEGTAERFREALVKKYGAAGEQATHAEALEVCEYGRRMTPSELAEMFPF